MSKRLAVIYDATPTLDEPPGRVYISKNEKTGWSINTAIAHTCRPSAACAAYCYGLRGRLAFPGALQRQAENAAFFELPKGRWSELRQEARDLVHVVARQQRFIRMFGVGDLQPGSVYFINEMAAYAQRVKPEFAIWVASRKYDLAAKLHRRANLHIMLSFDATTPPRALAQGLRLVTQRAPQVFAAWTHQAADENVPPWVKVVFEQHQIGPGRARWAPEPRACPATVHNDHGGTSHARACAACRFCFDATRRKGVPHGQP